VEARAAAEEEKVFGRGNVVNSVREEGSESVRL